MPKTARAKTPTAQFNMIVQRIEEFLDQGDCDRADSYMDEANRLVQFYMTPQSAGKAKRVMARIERATLACHQESNQREREREVKFNRPGWWESFMRGR